MTIRAFYGGDVDLRVEQGQLADGRTTLAVFDEVDVHSGAQLRGHLARLFAADRFDVVLDLRGLTFMDSTGLGVLVGAFKKARAHDGSVELVLTCEHLLRLFAITGLDQVFTIHPDLPPGRA